MEPKLASPAADWLPHLGGPCPVLPDTLVEIRWRSGGEDKLHNPQRYDWAHSESWPGPDIVAYRLAPLPAQPAEGEPMFHCKRHGDYPVNESGLCPACQAGDSKYDLPPGERAEATINAGPVAATASPEKVSGCIRHAPESSAPPPVPAPQRQTLTTQCWNCRETYLMAQRSCPNCLSANANHCFDLALEQNEAKEGTDNPYWTPIYESVFAAVEREIVERAAKEQSERLLAAAAKDAARLDWLESQHTLHRAVEFLYVVDGYECNLTYDGKVTAEYHGGTFREAIDTASKDSPK